jgi:hypothetical protein
MSRTMDKAEVDWIRTYVGSSRLNLTAPIIHRLIFDVAVFAAFMRCV